MLPSASCSVAYRTDGRRCLRRDAVLPAQVVVASPRDGVAAVAATRRGSGRLSTAAEGEISEAWLGGGHRSFLGRISQRVSFRPCMAPSEAKTLPRAVRNVSDALCLQCGHRMVLSPFVILALSHVYTLSLLVTASRLLSSYSSAGCRFFQVMRGSSAVADGNGCDLTHCISRIKLDSQLHVAEASSKNGANSQAVILFASEMPLVQACHFKESNKYSEQGWLLIRPGRFVSRQFRGVVGVKSSQIAVVLLGAWIVACDIAGGRNPQCPWK